MNLKPIFTCMAAAMLSFASPDADAKKITDLPHSLNISRATNLSAPGRDSFKSQRSKQIARLNARLANPGSRARLETLANEAPVSPSQTLGPTRIFYDIDGPDGELWYCTAELSSKVVPAEYYTEYILREYSFTIYDSSFNLVGTVHDKMRYNSDEVRVPGPDEGISILPVITRHFFNSDDRYEIAVSVAVNTTTPGINHYRSIIYSIGGEKETVKIERGGKETDVVVDKPVMQFDAFFSDVLDASTSTEENFYMTIMSEFGYFDIDFDKLFDGDEAEGKKYWEALSTSGYKFTTYAKAGTDGKLAKVFEQSVPYQMQQGDQESTPVMLTLCHNGTPYILFPHYKETFFNPYYSPYEDMTMRENNTLLIDLYRIDGSKASLVSSTPVPVEKAVGDYVLATYYSVGDLRYARDIEFGDGGAPVYTVTRCNYTTVSDETSGFCYYKYDSTGNKTLTIFENADSRLDLTDAAGHDSQVMFVSYDDEEGYVYNFVDISKGYNADTVKISYLLDTGYDEPEVLSFNVDRVPLGDSYKYAFEMSTPLVDEYDNNYMRIAWFNADGSFDRIDYVNMGNYVNYATTYINGVVLAPGFIKSDATHEYLILIKRGLSDETSLSQEELLIAQPTDEDLEGGCNILHLTPCDKGALQSISVYPGTSDDNHRLFVGYSTDSDFTADFYDLPFDLNAIESIVADGNGSPIHFDGTTLTAEGLAITVYSTAGSVVATGRDTLDVSALPSGVYVAKTDVSAGKFIVK